MADPFTFKGAKNYLAADSVFPCHLAAFVQVSLNFSSLRGQLRERWNVLALLEMPWKIERVADMFSAGTNGGLANGDVLKQTEGALGARPVCVTPRGLIPQPKRALRQSCEAASSSPGQSPIFSLAVVSGKPALRWGSATRGADNLRISKPLGRARWEQVGARPDGALYGSAPGAGLPGRIFKVTTNGVHIRLYQDTGLTLTT